MAWRLSARSPPNPALPSPSPSFPPDPKVVRFYARLRERQLRDLGLDPAQFKTLS
jgi:hypothetical protein